MAKLLEPVAAAESQGDEDEPEDEGDPGLLRVPLFIGLAARVYDPQKPLLGKEDLFERYIDRQLSREVRESDRLRKDFKNRQWAYETLAQEPDWRDVRRSLGWLAGQLQERNQVELLIEKMQPSWLDEGRSRWRYWLMLGPMLGLSFGLSVGLILCLISLIEGLISGSIITLLSNLIRNLIRGLTLGLTWGLTYGLILGLTYGLIGELNNIEPVESFRISMLPREVLRSLLGWLFCGLLLGGLLSWLDFGLILGLTYGLIGWLTIGLTIGLIGELRQELKMRSRPNQGIWNSLYSFVWITIFSYPLAVIGMTGITTLPIEFSKVVTLGQSLLSITEVIQKSLLQTLSLGIVGALLYGFFVGGGIACIQHFCLRLILTQDRKTPWNYARFLNYCVERRLLQRIGGRYRFIHRELLDHFALSKNYPL